MTQSVRSGRELIDATRPYAREDRARSWFHTLGTYALLASATFVAAAAPWWPVRVIAACFEALLLIRAFILYHDYLHGALLRKSWVARAMFTVQGILMLNPPRVWADTHNEHHANTARIMKHSAGTYELWTTDRWRDASWIQRLAYRLERHPINVLFGHVTVFFVGMCVLSFIQNPKRYASSGLAAVLQVAIGIAVWKTLGTSVLFTAMLAPFFAASAFGSYLFYVQHSFPGIRFRSDEDWSHAEAAIEGSSYLKTGRIMQFFTGNIGYHHVHHLNARIPFYRLPEAMAAIPELQNPGTSTLGLRDIIAAFKLDLWDAKQGRMVTFGDAYVDRTPARIPSIRIPSTS